MVSRSIKRKSNNLIRIYWNFLISDHDFYLRSNHGITKSQNLFVQHYALWNQDYNSMKKLNFLSPAATDIVIWHFRMQSLAPMSAKTSKFETAWDKNLRSIKFFIIFIFRTYHIPGRSKNTLTSQILDKISNAGGTRYFAQCHHLVEF